MQSIQGCERMGTRKEKLKAEKPRDDLSRDSLQVHCENCGFDFDGDNCEYTDGGLHICPSCNCALI